MTIAAYLCPIFRIRFAPASLVLKHGETGRMSREIPADLDLSREHHMEFILTCWKVDLEGESCKGQTDYDC